jgi:hypothetical protein
VRRRSKPVTRTRFTQSEEQHTLRREGDTKTRLEEYFKIVLRRHLVRPIDSKVLAPQHVGKRFEILAVGPHYQCFPAKIRQLDGVTPGQVMTAAYQQHKALGE